MNKSDMKARRKTLKTVNLPRGQPETDIAIQSNGMFNKPLYSVIGKTPFQPATQCSYSVVKMRPKKKQIIAMENVSKLCSKHGYFSSTDERQCDIKPEKKIKVKLILISIPTIYLSYSYSPVATNTNLEL